MFEEDVTENLRTCVTLAPQYCSACGDFHLWWALRRVGGFADPQEWDGFREGISRGIAEARAVGRRPAVLIAGAADTGILKTVVDAAFDAGGSKAVKEIDVTIADLCETPLQMCRDYAAQYGVSLETVRTDIGAYSEPGKYDVIAMHEVLTFFPVEERLKYLRKIATWIRPGGLLVTWSIVHGQGQAPRDKQERYDASLAALDGFLNGPGLDLRADVADMHRRMDRGSKAKSAPRTFLEAGDVGRFHRDAGLEIVEELVLERPPRAGKSRECVVIVARPPA